MGIKTKLRAVAAVVVLAAAGASANAAIWVDEISADRQLLSGQMYNYTHDITNDGFTAGVDIALGSWLDVLLDANTTGPEEYARVSTSGCIVGCTISRAIDNNEMFSFFVLTGINDGKLDVSIRHMGGTGQGRTGDPIWFRNSRWEVAGIDRTPVPEPGTLALLGLGLAGLGLVRRKRAA